MPENTPTAKDARSARRWCCCVLLAVLWCASLPLACLPGPVPVAVDDVWQALGAVVGLCPPADSSVQLVVGQIRLARVLLGLLCGGALAVAGVALQGVLRNPLADPFTLGISAGAACGASMAIALGGTLGIWAGGLAVGLSAAATVSLAALLGSLLALGGALWLGSGQGSFRRETVILAGIAVAAFLGAVVALVKALNEESIPFNPATALAGSSLTSHRRRHGRPVQDPAQVLQKEREPTYHNYRFCVYDKRAGNSLRSFGASCLHGAWFRILQYFHRKRQHQRPLRFLYATVI